MTPAYLGRLLLLASASFFLVQIAAAALIASFAGAAIRRSSRMRPRSAARFMFTLRMLPAALSGIVVAGLCVPSYLRFEPRAAEEEVSFACLAAAILGVLFGGVAIARAVVALVRSARFVRESAGVESCLEGEQVWVVKRSAGLALAGVLRPKLLISENTLRELSSAQIALALQHERAHRASRDNLKRLLIVLAPSLFSGLRMLEQAWARFAEWAADDEAARTDSDRFALAEALVCVARLQAGTVMPALVTCLVEGDENLSQRVDRLLETPSFPSPSRIGALALTGAALALFSLALNPDSQRLVHYLLERLLD
jgi:beta-lactamase regulating signal transducer with metallopeptidase domain